MAGVWASADATDIRAIQSSNNIQLFAMIHLPIAAHKQSMSTRFVSANPLLGPRRGGRDINKHAAKPPLLERTGWLVQLPIIRWFERTTPSAPANEASRNFISAAATPPLPRRGLRPLNRSATAPARPSELSSISRFTSHFHQLADCCSRMICSRYQPRRAALGKSGHVRVDHWCQIKRDHLRE